MKINFDTPILDEDEQPIKEGPFQTLGSAACIVCSRRDLRGDDNMTVERAGELGFLVIRIKFQPELDLKAEEVSIIKERIGKACPPVVVYRCHRLLEGKSQTPTAEEMGIRAVSNGNGKDHSESVDRSLVV